MSTKEMRKNEQRKIWRDCVAERRPGTELTGAGVGRAVHGTHVGPGTWNSPQGLRLVVAVTSGSRVHPENPGKNYSPLRALGNSW
jgi:hypothetical protein